MENLKNHKHTMDLFEMYESDFKVLCSDHDALQLENAEIKLHFENKLTAERKKTMALSQEIDQLKKKLQRANSTSTDKVTSVTVVPGRNLDVKQSAEYQMLAAELKMEKKKREVFLQNITELNHQLQTERDLRAKAETRADEAVDIADELMHKLEEMNNTSRQTLDADFKAKVEGLQLELHELNQVLQKEKELRVQAEVEKVVAVKTAEAVKRCSDNALQSLNTLEKTLEDAANRCMAERKKSDGLQQEILDLLQKQSDLRDQIKSDSLTDFEILEALCQELAEVERVSEDQTAMRETLATRLETEEKQKKGLCPDVLWLIQILQKEMELRAGAEADKREAIEVGEELCKKLKQCKVCSTVT